MLRGRRCCADCVGAHRPRDVLELPLAQVTEGEFDLASGILAYPRRDANATRLGQAFEPGRDVDAIAKDVAILDVDVTHVDADAQIDALFRWQRGITFGHCSLDLGGTAQSVDDAGELDQQPITGGFDDAAVMFCNFRVDHLGAERLQPAERPFLVGSDQAQYPATSAATIAASRRSTRAGPAAS